MIDQLVRKQIKTMQEINWGEVSDNTPYRLLWGENQQILDVYREPLSKEIDKINLYPSPTKKTLKEKISQYNKVKPENIVVTNGSDEAIEIVAKIFISENDQIVLPIPTFPVYESTSLIMGGIVKKVPLEKDLSLNINSLLKVVNAKTKVVWIANPNNPTGNILLQKKQIADIAKKLNCIVVIDECYFELSGVTAASLINKYPNIIIIRSFSKVFALAGLRLGYIIANEKITSYFNRVIQTNQVFNVNRFAQVAGIAILSKPQVIKSSVANLILLKQNFEKLLGNITLDVIPTKTTFCLVKLPENVTGKKLKTKLQQNGIFIKDCSIYEGLGEQYIYLGIPQKQYQKFCVEKIKEALEELSC